MSTGFNRFSSLDATTADQILTKSIMEEYNSNILKYMEEISCEDISESNMLSEVNNITDSVLETFEEDIEADFNQQYLQRSITESALVSIVNEDASDRSQKYISKINSVIDKTIANIKEKAVKLNKTAVKIINSDNDTYEKYSKALKAGKSLDGFGGIKNFSFVNNKTIKIMSKLGTLVLISTTFKSDDKESVNKEIIELTNQAFKDAESKWIPDKDDLKLLNKIYFDSKNITITIGSICNSAENQLNQIKSSAEKEIEKIMSYKDKEDVSSKLNDLYRAVSVKCQLALKSFSCYSSMQVKELSIIRTVFLTCGRYATNKSAKNESVEEQLENNSVVYESCIEYMISKFDL